MRRAVARVKVGARLEGWAAGFNSCAQGRSRKLRARPVRSCEGVNGEWMNFCVYQFGS